MSNPPPIKPLRGWIRLIVGIISLIILAGAGAGIWFFFGVLHSSPLFGFGFWYGLFILMFSISGLIAAFKVGHYLLKHHNRI